MTHPALESEEPAEPTPGGRMLGWVVDIVLGTLSGLLIGFLAMVVIDRLDRGMWSVLPPLGVLAGLAAMRWDRDRAPHPGRHRGWVTVVTAILAVASIVLFVSLAFAISNFQ